MENTYPNDEPNCGAEDFTPEPEPEMPYYVGVKVIQAAPMSRREFLRRKGPEPDLSVEDFPGYLVRYADNYESWSPVLAFEEAYVLMPNKAEAEDMRVECLEILGVE